MTARILFVLILLLTACSSDVQRDRERTIAQCEHMLSLSNPDGLDPRFYCTQD